VASTRAFDLTQDHPSAAFLPLSRSPPAHTSASATEVVERDDFETILD
jgi:hypothetical protein